MRQTIHDVALAAGVSIKTVSRVLNGEKHVREVTRDKVDKAIKSLNFRPSSAARALAGGRSKQIALLYDNPSPYYIYHVQTGARQRCRELGFRILFQECDVGSAEFLDEIKALIDETHLDGLILSPPVTDQPALLAELTRRGLPFVRIAPGADPDIGPFAYMDDVAAAMDMTRHLAGLGHERIGFVIGHPDHASARDRLRGYKHGLAAAGLIEDPVLIRQGLYSYESGRVAGQELLKLDAAPTAIFASNDDMAAGVMAVAHELGIAVPDQLSIAGFDDTDLARSLWPPLTTIRQPTRDLAVAAVNLLLDGKHRSPACALRYELMVRSSTAIRVRESA